MYITPNTDIKLYNIPLNKNSDDTLWFNDVVSQTNYFNNHLLYTFANCTYTREHRGMCRVERVIGDLYSANYMSFKNTSFGNKTFYAWVDSLEYINNVTTEIRFTIDPIQTWFFQMELGECFIERQHSLTDDIGDNILPENVELGEYVLNGTFQTPPTSEGVSLTDTRIVVAVNVTQQSGYTMYGNVFGGSELHIWDTTEAAAVKTFLDGYIQQPDEVLSVYMVPAFTVGYQSGGAVMTAYSGSPTIYTRDTAITTGDTIDGYLPLNHKLYTYPYNFYSVYGCGSALSLRYEFFDNLTPVLYIYGTPVQPVEVSCVPCSYKNVPPYTELGGYRDFQMEKLTLRGFPVGSWKVDAYDAWVAQNSVPMLLNGFKTVLTGGALAVSGRPISGAMNVVSGVVDTLSAQYTASIQADITKGNYQSGNSDFTHGHMHYYSGRMSITYQYAKSIDEFFTMFGYKQNKVGKPNLHARARYTYVKTVDAQIQGNMPVDDADAIASMLNNGLRFWCDYTNTGIYPDGVTTNLDNLILP